MLFKLSLKIIKLYEQKYFYKVYNKKNYYLQCTLIVCSIKVYSQKNLKVKNSSYKKVYILQIDKIIKAVILKAETC